MKVIYIVFFAILVSSCSSLNDAVKDLDYYIAGPQISYTRDRVRVLYKDYRTAPYKQNQIIYLVSPTHGGIVSKGQFRAIREFPAARTFALEAIFPMPQQVPNTNKDTCFHITDGNNNQAKVIAVKPDPSSWGFVNEIWQANVATPTQLKFIDSEQTKNATKQKNLDIDYQSATKYLSNSDIYINKQCVLPQNNKPSPANPHENFILKNDAKYIAYSVCHNTRYENKKLKDKFIFYLDSKSGKANKYENSAEDFNKSLIYLSNYSNQDHTSEQVSTFLSYSDRARSIFSAAKPEKNKCTALSNCSIYDELYHGSNHRDYLKTFERCAQDIEGRITQNKNDYARALKVWEVEPYNLQEYCKTQSTVADKYQENIKKLNENNILLASEKERLSHVKRHSNETNYWRSAREATCSIN